MENENEIVLKKNFTDKLYGGLRMNWLTVIIFAVCTAVLTAVFLIVPVFKGTSFERMGVTYEAWFFFAIIIMANCKKPLESALKTFVFFLISQPLIYLIEVPFSDMGWGLFGYYKYWFIITLLTFPMAFVGWYITKRNWLSVLILSPVLVFMALTTYECATHCVRHFPYLLVTALFCIMQIVLYVIAFMPGWKRKAVGFAIPVITMIVVAVFSSQVNLNGEAFLPDDRTFSDEAVIVMEENDIATVSFTDKGDNSIVNVKASKYGTTEFSIKDGDNEYFYTVEIYEDESGHPQIEISPKE